MVHTIKEEIPSTQGSVGGEDNPVSTVTAPIIAKSRGGVFGSSSDLQGNAPHGLKRLRNWIDHGGNVRLLAMTVAPIVLLLLFPVMIALRLLVLLCLPVSCLIPVYAIFKGAVLTNVHTTAKAALIILYLGALAFAVVPYFLVWPFYGFLEVFPACIMTIPILLASVPLAVCGCLAGGTIWFLSSSDFYSQHSYRASGLGAKKI